MTELEILRTLLDQVMNQGIPMNTGGNGVVTIPRATFDAIVEQKRTTPW